MPYYRKLGTVPPKRHITFRHEPGFRGEGIYYEEVVTTAGFGRAYSICYHLRPPTRVRKVELAGTVTIDAVSEPVLRHHHLKSKDLRPTGDWLPAAYRFCSTTTSSCRVAVQPRPRRSFTAMP